MSTLLTTITASQLPNAKDSQRLVQQVHAGVITWGRVIAVLLATSVLAIVIQSALAFAFYLAGTPAPWDESVKWWSVYGTLIDVGRLALLTVLLRKEGLRVWDLLRTRESSFVRDLLIGAGLFVVIFLVAIVGAAIPSGLLVYGVMQPEVGIGTLTARALPFWAILYSLLIWWFIWSPTMDFSAVVWTLQF